jgi:chromosome segregation ATPase
MLEPAIASPSSEESQQMFESLLAAKERQRKERLAGLDERRRAHREHERELARLELQRQKVKVMHALDMERARGEREAERAQQREAPTPSAQEAVDQAREAAEAVVVEAEAARESLMAHLEQLTRARSEMHSVPDSPRSDPED